MKASAQTLFAAGASVVVLGVIAAGLYLNGSPAEVRRQRLDEQRIASLTAISHAIDSAWQAEKRLPENLEELGRDMRFRYIRARDPVTGEEYEYRVTGPQTYELCTVFETTGAGMDSEFAGGAFWNHGPGRHCFAFTARPTPYPVR